MKSKFWFAPFLILAAFFILSACAKEESKVPPAPSQPVTASPAAKPVEEAKPVSKPMAPKGEPKVVTPPKPAVEKPAVPPPASPAAQPPVVETPPAPPETKPAAVLPEGNPANGAKIFVTSCQSCHGKNGDAGVQGGMKNAANFANLEANPPRIKDILQNLPTADHFKIVKLGGLKSGVKGATAAMPGFGTVLKEQQIADVVAYERSLPAFRNSPR